MPDELPHAKPVRVLLPQTVLKSSEKTARKSRTTCYEKHRRRRQSTVDTVRKSWIFTGKL